MVTFERPEGFVVAHSFGVVSGEAVMSRNLLHATFRSIGAFIGIANLEASSDAERARGEALERLRGNAESLGANGVIGLRFDASEFGDGATRVIASGEAVLLSPAPT